MSGERPEEEEQQHGHRYVRMTPEPEGDPAVASFRLPESARAFDELPRARIVGVSRPDAGDITPMLLSYTIEVQYKQVRGLLLLLHFSFFMSLFSCWLGMRGLVLCFRLGGVRAAWHSRFRIAA